VSTSVTKWSEGLSNAVSIIIRRYIDHIWLFLLSHFFPYSSVSILYYCIYSCKFCMLLFNFVKYIFLLLCNVFFCSFKNSYCYVCSVLGIPFHCVVLCIVCV
jgi:hypothetical protein